MLVTGARTRVSFEIYEHIIVAVSAAGRAPNEVAIFTHGRHKALCAIMVDLLSTTVSQLRDTRLAPHVNPSELVHLVGRHCIVLGLLMRAAGRHLLLCKLLCHNFIDL